MSDDRDLELGTALRALPTPEHRPGFWEDLDRELAVEGPAPVRRSARHLRSFRHRPFPGLVALAAAVALVVAAVAVLRPDDERGETRVATDPPTSTTTAAAPQYRPGPEQALGAGTVAGISSDGSAALVVVEDPDTSSPGCEDTRATTLFTAPLDGEARQRAVPEGDPLSGTVVPNPVDPARVAIVSVCEEFLSGLVVARQGPGGALSDLVTADRHLLVGLAGRFAWTRDGSALLGVVPDSGDVVRVDPRASTRTTVLAGAGAFGVGELDDGSLAVLTGDQRLRLGDVVHTVPAVGITVSPDGSQVAAYGDGVWLFAPGRAPRQLTTNFATAVTWAPDGRALAVTEGGYPDGGALSVVSLDGAVSVLTTSGAVGAAHFTPDGRALAFTRIDPSDGAAESGQTVERAVAIRFE